MWDLMVDMVSGGMWYWLLSEEEEGEGRLLSSEEEGQARWMERDDGMDRIRVTRVVENGWVGGNEEDNSSTTMEAVEIQRDDDTIR